MIEIIQGFDMNTNIIDAAEEAFLEAQDENELLHMESLQYESTILLDASFKGELVFEDVKIAATDKPIEQKLIKGNANRLQNYYKKIIKFLSDIKTGINNTLL